MLLHQGIFIPLFSKKHPDPEKAKRDKRAEAEAGGVDIDGVDEKGIARLG